MPNQPYYVNSPPTRTYSDENKFKDFSWIFIGFIVLFLHALLPWLTHFSAPEQKKQLRQKVIVQTVSLAPKIPQQLIAQAEAELPKIKPELQTPPPPPAPLAELVPPSPPLPIPEIPKEKEATQQLPKTQPAPIIPDMAIQEPIKPEPEQMPVNKELPKEEPPPPLPESAKEEPPKPEPKEDLKMMSTIPSVPKKENQLPKPAPPKKSVSKPVSKPVAKPEKKTAPVKKPIPAQPKKPVESPAMENREQLAALEAEKKKQQELKAKLAAEKMQKEKDLQAKEAEKRRLEEMAKKEAEKAEEERKKQKEQEEIAACQKVLANALAKNKENRDKVSSKPGLNLQNTAIPNTIDNLNIDNLKLCIDSAAGWSAKEIDYRDEIAQILQRALRLPEFGSIQIELTINKNGKVEKVRTLSSESAKNKQYVEQKVAGLKFPLFGNRFQESSQCTFTVTLNNERKT